MRKLKARGQAKKRPLLKDLDPSFLRWVLEAVVARRGQAELADILAEVWARHGDDIQRRPDWGGELAASGAAHRPSGELLPNNAVKPRPLGRGYKAHGSNL